MIASLRLNDAVQGYIKQHEIQILASIYLHLSKLFVTLHSWIKSDS